MKEVLSDNKYRNTQLAYILLLTVYIHLFHHLLQAFTDCNNFLSLKHIEK